MKVLFNVAYYFHMIFRKKKIVGSKHIMLLLPILFWTKTYSTDH